MKTRKEIAQQEATRDPIFLLQTRQVVIKSAYLEYDSDTEKYIETDLYAGDEPESYTLEELLEKGDDWAEVFWNTDLVFFTRDEAEGEAERRSYHYGRKGIDWRVYCVCAEGELKDILNGAGEMQKEIKKLQKLVEYWACDIRNQEKEDHQHEIKSQVSTITQLIDAAEELRDLMEGVRNKDYFPDSFTCQPINAALTIAKAKLEEYSELLTAKKEDIV